jgi:hypothetical protein
MKFKVRVYVNGSAPVVLDGGNDPLGAYIIIRPSTKEAPGFRLSPQPGQLRALPPGSDADYEFLPPMPSEHFKA